jgi:hypothetical protein
MAWLRLYDTMLDNRKVQVLPPELFKALINLWCVAKRHGGIIPSVGDAAYSMRASERDVVKWIDQLVERSLIDRGANGTFQPHDWDEHQFVSDNVSGRVQKHRAKQKAAVTRNVSVTGTRETFQVTPKKPPEQSRTDQSISEQNTGSGVTLQPYSQSENLQSFDPVSAPARVGDVSAAPSSGFGLEGQPSEDEHGLQESHLLIALRKNRHRAGAA